MIKRVVQSPRTLSPIPHILDYSWALFFILLMGVSFSGYSQNPFTNPSFEQFTTSGNCNRPVGWNYEDATTNFTDFGKLCVNTTVSSDSSRSLQVNNNGSGSTNNEVAVYQNVNLTSVDSLAFDIIGPGNGNPGRARVIVLVDGLVINQCGSFNGGQTKTCKVDLSTYAGTHEFRILFDQTDGDNLGNGAIDNIRPVDNCANASVTPTFTVSGPSSKDVGHPALFTVTTTPDSAFGNYRWLVDGNFIAEGDTLHRSFQNQGQHSIQLVASHCSGSDTVTKTLQATMPSTAPTSDFTASRTTIDASEKVVFTDQSTNTPSSWQWSISPTSNSPKDANFIYMDSSDANSQHPAVRFFEPGVYEVCLTASNAAGTGNQECKSAYITVNKSITTNDDTMFVNNAQDTTWQEHGVHSSWAQFPSDTNRFRKILLKYTLGCTNNGCSDWDYTNKVEIVYPTGKIDTNIVLAPQFKVEGKRRDTFRFSNDTTWITYFDQNTNSTDSIPHPQRKVTLYNDPNNPQRVTDAMYVYPANHSKDYYDNNGNVITSKTARADSTWVAEDDTIYRTKPEEDIVEIARANTPYAGNFPSSWNRTWTFDVTEYAPVLANAREVRTYYRGNTSTGTFTIDLDFELIKGIPPRDTREVRVLWKSAATGAWYGYPEKPIDSFFVDRTVKLNQNAANSMVRVSVNGHGFGGADNCAEFCPKNYYIKINGQQRHQQQISRSNCGMNPLFPQAGTWIYDRTNWCPGDRILPYDHEVGSYVNKGSNNTFDITMDPFTYDGGGTPSRWVYDVQLFSFSEPNFISDASVKKIIAPNDNWYENRFNPRCDNPIVEIRNTGRYTLNSLTLKYGVVGTKKLTHTWQGQIEAFDSDTIHLPGPVNWDSPDSIQDKFYVEILNVNSGPDQYAANNKLTSDYELTPKYPGKLEIQLQTNSAPDETSYQIKNAKDSVLFERSNFSANSLHIDTVDLPKGCYQFTVFDDAENGLEFFANNDGNGSVKIYRADNDNISLLKDFESNFGTRISQWFTVGYDMDTAGVQEPDEPEDTTTIRQDEQSYQLRLYPNPANDQLTIDLRMSERKDLDIQLISLLGNVKKSKTTNNYKNRGIKFDLSTLPTGVYLVKIKSSSTIITEQFIKQE